MNMNVNIGIKIQPLTDQEKRKPKPDVGAVYTPFGSWLYTDRSHVWYGAKDWESGRFHPTSATNPALRSGIPSTLWSQSLMCIICLGTGWFVSPLSALTARRPPKAPFSCSQLLLLASPDFLSQSFVFCSSLLAFKKNLHPWHIIKMERGCTGTSQVMPLLNAVAGL